MLSSLASIVPEHLAKRLRHGMPHSPCSVKHSLLPVYSADCTPPPPPPPPPEQFAALQLDLSGCAPQYSAHQLRRMLCRLVDANSFHSGGHALPAVPLPQHVVITLNAADAHVSQHTPHKSLVQSWCFSNPMMLMFALLFTAFVAAYMCASSLLP